MMMSSAWKKPASSFAVSPAYAAGTMIQAARGSVSLEANSSSEYAPVAPAVSISFTTSALTS